MRTRKIIAMISVVTALGIYLFAAVVIEFDATKRYDKVKITDITVALKVPVERNGAVRPVIPADIKELRKSQVVSYSGGTTAWANSAVVVMIIPAEYLAEFLTRVGKHPELQVLERGDLMAMGVEFADGEAKLVLMEAKVDNALTPALGFE